MNYIPNRWNQGVQSILWSHQRQKWVWVQVIYGNIITKTFQIHLQWQHDTKNNLKYIEKTVEDIHSFLVWLHLEVRGVSVQRVHWFSASDQMFYQMIKLNESAAEICVSWVLLTQLTQLHKMMQARDKHCRLPLMLCCCLFTRFYLFTVQVNVKL